MDNSPKWDNVLSHMKQRPSLKKQSSVRRITAPQTQGPMLNRLPLNFYARGWVKTPPHRRNIATNVATSTATDKTFITPPSTPPRQSPSESLGKTLHKNKQNSNLILSFTLTVAKHQHCVFLVQAKMARA